jgi:hypothetical protein
LDSTEQLTIVNIANGAAVELFDRELTELLRNINDANTDPEAKRSITLEFVFSPFKDRSGAQVEIKCRSKSATVEAANGQIFISRQVNLRPYRTFQEIQPQIESQFLFRLQQRSPETPPLLALFEADGAKWRLDAMQQVKKSLDLNTEIDTIA